MAVLGFQCSAGKEEPFAPSASLLGVQVDLSEKILAAVRVSCGEVAAAIDLVLSRGSLKS